MAHLQAQVAGPHDYQQRSRPGQPLEPAPAYLSRIRVVRDEEDWSTLPGIRRPEGGFVRFPIASGDLDGSSATGLDLHLCN
jgi:hypothetical protein